MQPTAMSQLFLARSLDGLSGQSWQALIKLDTALKTIRRRMAIRRRAGFATRSS